MSNSIDRLSFEVSIDSRLQMISTLNNGHFFEFYIPIE